MNKKDKADFLEMTLENVVARIEKLPPGQYEASTIFGDSWPDGDSPVSPISLGKAFKKHVDEGRFRKVTLLTTKTNNHKKYEVL